MFVIIKKGEIVEDKILIWCFKDYKHFIVFILLSTNVFCEKCFMKNILVKEKNILSL